MLTLLDVLLKYLIRFTLKKIISNICYYHAKTIKQNQLHLKHLYEISVGIKNSINTWNEVLNHYSGFKEKEDNKRWIILLEMSSAGFLLLLAMLSTIEMVQSLFLWFFFDCTIRTICIDCIYSICIHLTAFWPSIFKFYKQFCFWSQRNLCQMIGQHFEHRSVI